MGDKWHTSDMKVIDDGNELREFLGRCSVAEQERFAHDCGTTLNYLRKHLSKRTKMDVTLAARVAHQSRRVVPLSTLRPDVDWDLVRRLIPAPRRADRQRADQ